MKPRQRPASPATPHPEPPADSAPSWWRWYLIALFFVAILWRVHVLGRLAASPLNGLLMADSEVYWAWATEIRSGQWLATKPFFLAPLYPYGLAVVRAVLGDEISRVLVLQAFLGALSMTLLADAARRISTPRAAAIVGVALAGYGMTVFFDLLVLMESLLFFIGSLVLWLMTRGGRLSPLLVGSLVGVMALGRPTFLLLLLPYGFFAARRSAAHPAATLARVFVVPLAVIAITSVHHFRVTGHWIPLTYSGGFNLFVGNGPDANGTYVPVTNVADDPKEEEVSGGTASDGRYYIARTLGLNLSAGESDAFWRERAANQIREQPWNVARLFVRKIALLFNHRELPQIVDASLYNRVVGPLGWPLDLEFAFFGIGGLLGILLAWKHGPEVRLIAGCLAVLVLGTAVFFVVDRYRVHLVPWLAMLTAIGLARLEALWRQHDRRSVAIAAGFAAGAAALVFAPLVPASSSHADWVYATTMGDLSLARGDAQGAVVWLEKAVALDRSGVLQGASTPSGRIARAACYENLGIACARLGDRDQALVHLALAVELVPDSRPTRAQLAEQLALNGAWDLAAEHYTAAGISTDRAAKLLVEQAARQHALGNPGQAREYFAAAHGLRPDYEMAVFPLVRLDIVSGDLSSARTLLREAKTLGLDANVVQAHAAWIRTAEGDISGAERLIRSIPLDVRVRDPRVAGTLDLMHQTQRN